MSAGARFPFRVLAAVALSVLTAACGGTTGPSATSPDGGGSGSGGSGGPGNGGGGGSNQGNPGTGGGGAPAGSGGSNNGSGTGGVAVTGGGGNGGSLGGGVNIKGPTITITEFLIPTASQPGAMCAGPDGKLWFTHQSTAPSAVGNLTTAGTNFGLIPTQVTNTGPIAITGGPDGNVWYTKQGGLGKITPAGMDGEFGIPGGDSGGIIAGPDGNLWFTEPLHDKIGVSTPQNALAAFDIPTAGGHPFGITKGPDGNLWFTEAAAVGNKIGKITPAGMVTEYKIPTPSANPLSITAGPDGNLWFTEFDARKIGRVTPAGVVTEFALGSSGKPNNIATGDDGNMWFTEGGGVNLIGRITSMGGISEYPIPSANADGAGITAGPDKNVWFAELSTNKIARISNLTGGGTIDSVDGASAQPPMPMGTPCAKDNDCVSSGKACGGDVCSATAKVCVLSVSGDPGTCATAADCWCTGQGATCGATHHCSIIRF